MDIETVMVCSICFKDAMLHLVVTGESRCREHAQDVVPALTFWATFVAETRKWSTVWVSDIYDSIQHQVDFTYSELFRAVNKLEAI